MTFSRITSDPEIMAGAPIIRGLRIPVVTIVRMTAAGLTSEQICNELPVLEKEDITEALTYAAAVIDDNLITLSA